MGWHKGDWSKEWSNGSKQEYFDVWLMPEGDPWKYSFQTPIFSTDISQAWQVVKKMRKDGWTFSLSGIVYFRRKGGSGKGIGDSDPHSICLAALAAVGKGLI